MSVFLDYNVIIRILKGDNKTIKYAKTLNTTSILDLLMVYKYLLERNVENADEILEKLSKNMIIVDKISLEDIKEAAKLILEGIDLINSLSYVLSKKLNLTFVTTNEKLKDKENVQFLD